MHGPDASSWDGNIIKLPSWACNADAAAVIYAGEWKSGTESQPFLLFEALDVSGLRNDSSGRQRAQEMISAAHKHTVFLDLQFSHTVPRNRNAAIRTISPFDHVRMNEVSNDCNDKQIEESEDSSAGSTLYNSPESEAQRAQAHVARITRHYQVMTRAPRVLNNQRWNSVFVGNDTRRTSECSVLGSVSLQDFFDFVRDRTKIALSEEQRNAISGLGHITNGFGIIYGVEGSGKSLLDCLMAIVAESGTKKPVLFISEGNAAADSLCKRMTDLLTQMGQRPETAKAQCQRLYAENTENALLERHIEQFLASRPSPSCDRESRRPQSLFESHVNKALKWADENRLRLCDSRVTDWKLSVAYHTLQCHGFLDRRKPTNMHDSRAPQPNRNQAASQEPDSSAVVSKLSKLMLTDQEHPAAKVTGKVAIDKWKRLAMPIYERWECGEKVTEFDKTCLHLYFRGLAQDQLQKGLRFLFTTAHGLQNEMVLEAVDPGMISFQEAGRFNPLDLAAALHRFRCLAISTLDFKQLRPTIVESGPNV
ncbi:MAG: hypothetical protein MMC23_003305 [Stictis urceolatum]|nr:hypothetical protein [Stictis urceolata]